MRRALVCFAAVLLVGCPAPNDDELLQLVIVSRHGVRTPLEPFVCEGKEPAAECLDNWTRRPGGFPQSWNPAGWEHDGKGDLTKVGTELATLMGGYYGSRVTAALFPIG